MSDFRISDPLLRKIVYAVGLMGVIAFGFYTFSLLRGGIALVMDVLTPFLAALLLAYILAPIVIHLQQHLKMGRIVGTLALYVMIFLAVFLLLAFLIPTVITEFIRLFNTLKINIPPLLNKLAQNPYFQVDSELIGIIQTRIHEIQIDYEQIVSTILPGLKKMASGGLEAVGIATKGIFSGLGSVFSFFSFIIFVGIINFYFIVDWEKISPTIRKMVPPAERERVFDILEKTDRAVGGFLRGQLTVSLIVGFLFATGLFALGFTGFPTLRNYCVLIGTAAAIGGFIPYLGAVMGVTPAILIVVFTGGVAWSVKLITLGFVFLLFGAIQAVEGFVLQPKIVGKGAGLHPLAVMFALLFGAQFGIGGMIVAVPLAGIIRVLIREFYWLPIERREQLMIENREQT
ncbi:MAG: AI-2E family transporter [Desulfococcaceae bacterium]|jgi:predicted PurR-regulated permease PerM|nr:AI-2E family transporter [Desulfococcaceae bacterium]